ncbi:hypothetical protein [Myxosarcina sp. GI1(2024)]
MNSNLENLLANLLPNLLGFSLNFVDDLLCLLLSHLGIHLTWLQFCSYGVIAGKLIYWLLQLGCKRCF